MVWLYIFLKDMVIVMTITVKSIMAAAGTKIYVEITQCQALFINYVL